MLHIMYNVQTMTRPGRHRCMLNREVERGPYPAGLRAVLSAADTDEALRMMSDWSGYRPTPLRELPAVAGDLRVRRLWYKDESARFNVGSFKALGGAYAVYRLLRRRAANGRITFACATAGNHGVSVAWASRQWGAGCVIYVPKTVPRERVELLRSYGANVRVAGSSYDEAVNALADDADRNGWCVVSDTAYEGYTDIPADVMRGYTVLAREIVEQIPSNERLTHVFLQCGVGGLAAAVIAHFWETWGSERPKAVVVEADSAACFLESICSGTLAHSEDIRTQLVCLGCGRLSILAWPILRRGADFALTITDDAAFDAMRALANASDGAIRAGESGAAGLGGLFTALSDPQCARMIGIGPDSNVLVVGSEGPLNATLYYEITGRDSQAYNSPRR